MGAEKQTLLSHVSFMFITDKMKKQKTYKSPDDTVFSFVLQMMS